MQKSRQAFHYHQDRKRQAAPNSKTDKYGDRMSHHQSSDEYGFVKHRGKLCVSKTESPKTQIGCSVGDSTQHELNGMNHLLDEDLGKFKFLFIKDDFPTLNRNKLNDEESVHSSREKPLLLLPSPSK